MLYGSTYYLLKNGSTFLSVYAAVFAAQLIICIIYLIMIRGNENIPYNRLINPVTIFGGAWFIFFLIVRLGAIMNTYYYPSYYFIYVELVMTQTELYRDFSPEENWLEYWVYFQKYYWLLNFW